MNSRVLARPAVLLGAAIVASQLNPPLAVALLVSAVVIVALGLFAPGALARVDRVGLRAAVAMAALLGYVLSLAIWLVILVPLWLINLMLRFRPLSSGWTTASSAWTGSGARSSPDLQMESYRWPVALDPPVSRSMRRRTNLRRAVIASIAVLGVVALQPDLAALLPSTSAAPAHSPRKVPGNFAAQRPLDDPVPFEADPRGTITWSGYDGFAFEGKAWARELFRELNDARQQPDPVLGARNGEFRGQFLNIREGIRDTWTPAEPEVTVWYFGGSTMYGIGQRDDHTIPSVVARLAERDGIKIRSVNFGVSADVNWVETIRLAEALNSKQRRPDLIVFYDGSNEIGLGFERVDGGDREVSHSSRLSLSDAERAARAEQLAFQPALDPVARANLAAELSAAQYRRGVLTARSLARHQDIPVVHFWQPQPFARQIQDADPELHARLDFDVNDLPASTAIYDKIRIDSGVDPVDLSGVFDGTASRIYMDGSHTNESGAAMVGRAMYEELKDRLKRL